MPQMMQIPINNPLTVQLDLGGIWGIAVFVLLAIVVIRFIRGLRVEHRELPLAWQALWAYVLIYALYLFEYPAMPFGIFNAAYQVTAARVFAEALCIPLGAALLYTHAREILPYVVLVELAFVWVGHSGLMIAPSFDLAFCALAIPLCPWWVIAPVVITICTHHGSTAACIVVFQFLAYLAKNPRKYWKYAAAVLPIIFVAAWIHSGENFDYWDRYQHWVEYMSFWLHGRETVVPLAAPTGIYWPWFFIGVGPGTFLWTSLLLDKFHTDAWLQMHSDILQILWEFGAVGLCLVGLAFFRAIKDAWSNPRSVAALFGCIAFMLTYHPLRFGPTAFLMALIFVFSKKG